MTYRYLNRPSIMARMDAMSKFLWLLTVTIGGFVLGSWPYLALLLLATIAVGLPLGRVPLAVFWRGSAILWMLMVCLFVFQVLFQRHGPLLLQIGPLPVHAVGVQLGLLIGLRITLVSVAALFFIWTTNPRDFIVGLIRMGVPYRIGFATFVALGFVPLIEHEARVIHEAHLVRGVPEVSGRIESWKRYLVPLLAFAIRRAEAVAVAMDSRAFGALPHRTVVDEFRWTARGLVFVGLYVLLCAGLIYSAARGGGGLFQNYVVS